MTDAETAEHASRYGWCGETRPHEHGLSEGIVTFTDGNPAGPVFSSGTCEICGRDELAIGDSHPCSFGADDGPCSCWAGRPCELWAAGWNMPGYVPETDPEVFRTLTDAVAYLEETAHRFAENDADETGEEGATCFFDVRADGADAWYESAQTPSGLHFWAVRA